MLEFSTTRQPRARKEHVCDLCGCTIEAGEKYQYFAGMADGEFFVIHNHLECEAVIQEYSRETGEDEYDIDAINDWWVDCKCYNCKNYLLDNCDCNECDGFPTLANGNEKDPECPDNYKGKCKCGDICTIMDRRCWCTKYEPEEEKEN